MAGPVTTGAGGSEVSADALAPIIGVPDETPPKPVIPADGFHDTREVAAAEAGGFPSQQGYPLHPAAQEILKSINTGIAGARSHLDWMEAQLAKAAAIGSGH